MGRKAVDATHDFAQEHEVLKRILETLQPFDQDTRRRIMESVITVFGVRDAARR